MAAIISLAGTPLDSNSLTRSVTALLAKASNFFLFSGVSEIAFLPFPFPKIASAFLPKFSSPLDARKLNSFPVKLSRAAFSLQRVHHRLFDSWLRKFL